jgi:hemerythrin-like metal-binding protein
MAYIWDKSWEIGIGEIDRQHEQLLNVINKLGDAMKARKTGDVLLGVLDELDEYTRKHFAFEEALMKRYNYDGIEMHKPLHTKFITQVKDFKNQVGAGNITVGVKMYNFLGDWWREHIRGTDSKYAKVITEKGAR